MMDTYEISNSSNLDFITKSCHDIGAKEIKKLKNWNAKNFKPFFQSFSSTFFKFRRAGDIFGIKYHKLSFDR